MKFTLAEVTGGPAPVLAEFMRERRATKTIAMVVCRAAVERVALRNMAAIVHEPLQDMYDMYVLMNGERKDAESPDDWDAGIDDQTETLFEPYIGSVTADWLGRSVIDTRFYQEGEIANTAKSFAADAWRVLIHNSDPDEDEEKTLSTAKILSAVGIVKSDLEALIDERAPETVEQKKEIDMRTLHQTLNAIHAHCGGAFDPTAYADYFKMAMDEDDGLAVSGLHPMGATIEDAEPIRMFAMEHANEESAADALCDMLLGAPYENGSVQTEAAEAPPTGAAIPQVQTGVEPPAGGKADKTKGGPPPAGSIPPRAFALVREFVKMKDEDVGTALGISRQTFINYSKEGKTPFVASAEQRDVLLTIVRAAKAGLAEAEQLIG